MTRGGRKGALKCWPCPGFRGLFDLGHFLELSSLFSMYVILLLFSHSVVSTSLQPHGLQHARLPCPSSSPGVCSNSCPCLLYFIANLTLLFNMESLYRRCENKVESFEGLPRKMQMLFFKKGSIFHYGYGHMIPSKEKVPCAWGQGVVKITVTGSGQCLSFPNAYITAKRTPTWAKNFLPSWVCLLWPSGSV